MPLNDGPPVGLSVSAVGEASPAAAAGVVPGDCVVAVNGRPTPDILAFRYAAADGIVLLAIARGEERLALRLEEGDEPDAGLEFADELGDGTHVCNNRCVFCFIHQMPRGMRRSLYLKDDDFRLSFMHGNYVTLTNIDEGEFSRIIEQRLSPLYVSVHATDPELRGVLLGKRTPEPILPRLEALSQGRIDVHAQIVLCPGYNDGEALDRTLFDLSLLHPARTGRRAGVRSVAIVPVGLTQFRDRLPNLASPNRDYASAMIARARLWWRRFDEELGTRFAWLSDEWYFRAERPFPSAPHYEGFPQLDDGVGTVRRFVDSARSCLRTLRRRPSLDPDARAVLVTGELAGGVVRRFADDLSTLPGVHVDVCVVANRFFGGGISVTGLLTGQDIAAALRGHADGGPALIPRICLNSDLLFLDGMTVSEVAQQAGRELRVVQPTPSAVARELGLFLARRG